MPKWKELSTDTDVLKETLAKLYDKEMRLEADLAISTRPDLAEAITRLALAIADVKKIDVKIFKGEKPPTEAGRQEVEAIVARIEYLENQLENNRALLQEKGGKAAEKFAELRKHRNQSFAQLEKISDDVSGICQRSGVDLEKLLPSLTNYLSVAKPLDTPIDRQVANMVEPPEVREARQELERRLNLDTEPPVAPPAPPAPAALRPYSTTEPPLPPTLEADYDDDSGPTDEEIEEPSDESPADQLLRLFRGDDSGN